jgi:hypothetical protein
MPDPVVGPVAAIVADRGNSVTSFLSRSTSLLFFLYRFSQLCFLVPLFATLDHFLLVDLAIAVNFFL